MTMVLPLKQYDILLSSRADHPRYTFPNTNQFTGFAIRKNILYRELPDFTKINLNKKRLTIWQESQDLVARSANTFTQYSFKSRM